MKSGRYALDGVLLLKPMTTLATDYQDSEQIAPESAQQSAVGLERVEMRRALGPARAVMQDFLSNAPPYWRDTRASLKLRTFDFRRDDGDLEVGDAFAAGFELGVQSGKWRERFSFELSWHTSYGIRAPEDKGDTGILQPNQDDISVISRAFAQWSFTEKARLRLFRQDFNLPYINRQDSRMIPTTYEAYVFQHNGTRWQGIAGHITKVKGRESEEFVPMAERAGVPGGDSGTSVLGLSYDFPIGVKIGAVAQYTHDVFATTYSETTYNKTISEDWGLQLTAQLANQWSVGSELLGSFDTYAWGVRGRISYRGAMLSLASARTGSARIRSPFGGNPSYTVPMIGDFDRARERSVRVGLSQNFAPHGLPGLSVTVNYTGGRDAQTNDGVEIANTDELNVTADYRPERGLLKGMWLRVRWGEWSRGPNLPDREDLRFIVNYTISAFQ